MPRQQHPVSLYEGPLIGACPHGYGKVMFTLECASVVVDVTIALLPLPDPGHTVRPPFVAVLEQARWGQLARVVGPR